MTDIELSEIRARCEAATPGPWIEGCDEKFHVFVLGTDEKVATMRVRFDRMQNCINSIFITHARTDIPALLTHIDEQRTEIEYLKRTIGYLAVAFQFFTENWNVPWVNAEIEIAEAFTLAKKPDKDCEWMTINGYVDGAMKILEERGGHR